MSRLLISLPIPAAIHLHTAQFKCSAPYYHDCTTPNLDSLLLIALSQPVTPATMSNPIPIPSPVPIRDSHANATGSGSHRASSVGRSLSTRRSSQSQGASGLGRRPSRVTHPPPVPTRALSHDEALDALRGFLKERSSYDVFPVSFRLIVLDTTLKVKKALDVMLLYSKSCSCGEVGG
jgi:hypothetical protein